MPIYRRNPDTGDIYEVGGENDPYTQEVRRGPGFISDISEFKSPVTGEIITSRSNLREHLKRTGCRIVDPSEARDHGVKERQ